MNIHVNLSKKLLFEYWDEHRNKKNAVEATFLLIGHLEDGGMRVEVVKEADLESAKNKFIKVISEHIYSLQKTLPEIELLAISDNFDSRCGAIRCIDSVLRSEHEMDVLRWGTALSSHKPKNIVESSTSKVQGKVDFEKKSAEQSKNVKEPVVKTAAPKPAEKTQKSAFNNLFAKVVEKQNKDKASASQSSGGNKNKTTPTNNGRNNTSLRKNAWFEVKKKPESSNSSKDKVEVMDISEDSEKSIVEVGIESPEIKEAVEKEKLEETVKHVEKKKAAASTLRGKKRQSSSKDASVSKKRKRIVVISSEESSDSEVQDVEPDEPEEPQVSEKIRACSSPPMVKCEGGRRKIRKLIDKTFMDDEGYLVTQKEYVYESCSDKEDEKPAEIVKPITVEPAVKNNKKTKQASLLNFFKKS